MARRSVDLPDWVKGDWCDLDLAERSDDYSIPENDEDEDYKYLRRKWAGDLLRGDLKSAHRSWGRWQGFTGGDPWEDRGWRNFNELQEFGEQLWKDFDASRFEELVWLRTFISYWPGLD